MNKKQLTLCMVCSEDKVLLGMKKQGFGKGRWNGFGGKVEPGESIEEAAVREVEEECGITPKDMQQVGVLEFSFESDVEDILEVHVFKIRDFDGEPTETEEMKPQWFTFDTIPFHQMWSDDEHWFPYLLKGKIFRGTFHFDRPSDADYSAQIVHQDIQEIDNLTV